MPPTLPPGDEGPVDGSLPSEALDTLGEGPFGFYVHVPFCYRRCGYCDFNTYVPASGAAGEAAMNRIVDATLAEVKLSAQVLGAEGRTLPLVDTVFFGGGTPTMLPVDDLLSVLDVIRAQYGLVPGAEVTVEANPDTVTPESLAALATGGVTRISLGMQSAVPHVLATLDRTHTPDNVARAVRAAEDAGLVTSVDLIYGTPGESIADWTESLRAAIALEPEHISAYALVLEEGTSMHSDLIRGAIESPDDDDEADKYELADALLSAAGYRWYEVSNWTRTERGRGRHNEGYWRDGNWWGAGPGAHSHVGGVRWWNVKFPASYAIRMENGQSPAQAREVLSAEQRFTEKVMLGMRLAEGVDLDVLRSPYAAGPAVALELAQEGLLDTHAITGWGGAEKPRARLTMRGRLLADLVLRRLLGY